MLARDVILHTIKSQVQNIVPGASVLLFGSRAYGQPTEESDWDILVLVHRQVDNALKKQIHKVIFPISVQAGSFINTLVVQEEEWLQNPSYYALHQTVGNNMILI